MSNILEDISSKPQTYTSIRVDVEISFLPEKVRDAIFLDVHLTYHPSTRIYAVSVSAELPAEFQHFLLTDIVHLHDLGEKCFMNVLMYFRALGGIAH